MMQSAMRKLVNMRQEPKESLVNFGWWFMSQAEVTEDVWGKMVPYKDNGKSTTKKKAARNKYLACIFLAVVDRS